MQVVKLVIAIDEQAVKKGNILRLLWNLLVSTNSRMLSPFKFNGLLRLLPFR